MNFDNPSERQAIRDLVRELYVTISGPAGAPRDWATNERSFAPIVGRSTPFKVSPEGAITFESLTPQQYRESRGPWFEETPFYETEIGHDCAIEGRIAHVFSRYEARHDPNGEPFVRGVNSIQLVRTEDGWKVISMMWQFTGAGSVPKAR